MWSEDHWATSSLSIPLQLVGHNTLLVCEVGISDKECLGLPELLNSDLEPTSPLPVDPKGKGRADPPLPNSSPISTKPPHVVQPRRRGGKVTWWTTEDAVVIADGLDKFERDQKDPSNKNRLVVDLFKDIFPEVVYVEPTFQRQRRVWRQFGEAQKKELREAYANRTWGELVDDVNSGKNLQSCDWFQWSN
jgi:hypothetical protein